MARLVEPRPQEESPEVSEKSAALIRQHLRLDPVAGLDGVQLYQAHQGSRLSRLIGPDGAAPYWAYPWAGGLALARHLAAHPELVSGRDVLDLGAGSGLVGIVAAQRGARVTASEIDPMGRAAIALNAQANGVAVAVTDVDIDAPPPEGFSLILAGDVFYASSVANRMLPFLTRCAAAGMEVLIGDPGRRDLPRDRLVELARYRVGDVGDMRGSAERDGLVFRLAT